jgi:DNA-binding HxlR family transcriptional regulator
MAFSKANTFPEVPFSQSLWSKATCHPARIIILTHLLENGLSSFNEIRKKIPLATTTVSQHFRSLMQKGLIEAEVKFPYTYYKLNRKYCFELALIITELSYDFIKPGQSI